MGHERIGYLPKTKRWRDIVNNIGNFSSTNDNINNISIQTIKNVRNRFEYIKQDSGVIAAFKYLIILSNSGKLKDPSQFFEDNDIIINKDYDLIDLANSISSYISKNKESSEYSTIAIQSLIDTVSKWYQNHAVQKLIYFDSSDSSNEIWKKASSGNGFCELSRLFFAKFTERYMKYFLEREAAYKIDNLFDRTLFNNKLNQHVDDITKHAFETSKITQSFAAGWYNKNCSSDLPSDESIKGFISFSFQKINSELLREESSE
jgi:hypothetical protein